MYGRWVKIYPKYFLFRPPLSAIKPRNASTLCWFVLIIARVHLFYAVTPVWEVYPHYTILASTRHNYHLEHDKWIRGILIFISYGPRPFYIPFIWREKSVKLIKQNGGNYRYIGGYIEAIHQDGSGSGVHLNSAPTSVLGCFQVKRLLCFIWQFLYLELSVV